MTELLVTIALIVNVKDILSVVVQRKMNQTRIRKLSPGLFHCPLEESVKLLPDLKSVIDQAPLISGENYVIDVKVHMLMPNQWPCIPNWHFDNVPRDKDLNQLWDKRDSSKKMFLWCSNEPYTEFEWGFVEPQKWTEFTQFDLHRGTMSSKHIWRLWMRICPTSLLAPAPKEQWIRVHSQVYLDVYSFKW